MGRLNAHGAELEDVDLRGAELDGVTGVTGLRGTVVTGVQLGRRAPLRADALDITVVE